MRFESLERLQASQGSCISSCGDKGRVGLCRVKACGSTATSRCNDVWSYSDICLTTRGKLCSLHPPRGAGRHGLCHSAVTAAGRVRPAKWDLWNLWMGARFEARSAGAGETRQKKVTSGTEGQGLDSSLGRQGGEEGDGNKRRMQIKMRKNAFKSRKKI